MILTPSLFDSGGMVNPAVTIGLMVRNKLRIYEGAYCIFIQLTAGLMAGLLSFGLYGSQWDAVGAPIVNGDTPRGTAFSMRQHIKYTLTQ